MTIANNSSTHSGSLLLQSYFIWNIYLKGDCAFHNSHKDEDWKIDPPYGQLTDNVGILEFSLELD